MSRTILSFAAPCVALVVAATCAANDEQQRPNVIMILADDLGSVDLNCYGSTDLETPNLDALAERGIRFTQFYAAAPVCSPSRAAFITGMFPQRAGVPGNVSSHAGNAGMPASTPTVAEVFGANGYITGHVGKWHLGYTPETMPNGQGFVQSFGHMGGCIDNYSHFFYWNGPNRHDLWRNGIEVFHDGDYFPDLMADEAIRFITHNKDRPFMMYWALNTPHYPSAGNGQVATALRRTWMLLAECTQPSFPQQTKSWDEYSVSWNLWALQTIRLLSFSQTTATARKNERLAAAAMPGHSEERNSACLKAAFECPPWCRGRGIFQQDKFVIKWQQAATGCPLWRLCAS